MFITHFDPRDFIFQNVEGDAGMGVYFSDETVYADMWGSGQTFYLSLVLPTMFLSTLKFEFFLRYISFNDNNLFKISVDPYNNSNEDYTLNRIDPGNFINEELTDIAFVDADIVTKMEHIYSGLSHKSPGDRCMFKVEFVGYINLGVLAVAVRGV